MLAVDNFVVDSENTQAFNRYSYAMNNPLKFVDPSGEVVHIVVGAVIGGVINGVIHRNRPGGFWKGFAIGAVAGAVGAATGGAAFLAAGGSATVVGAGGFVAGLASGAAGSAASMPILSFGNNAVFGDPLYNAVDYAKGILGGALLGGVINGGLAAVNGNNFWSGTPEVTRSGIWKIRLPNRAKTGKIEVGMPLRDVNAKSVRTLAKNHNLKSGQQGKLSVTKIDEYLNKMYSGTFDTTAKENIIGGYIKNGTMIVGDGNHRVTAALIHGQQTGDYTLINQILNNGRWNVPTFSPRSFNWPLF